MKSVNDSTETAVMKSEKLILFWKSSFYDYD